MRSYGPRVQGSADHLLRRSDRTSCATAAGAGAAFVTDRGWLVSRIIMLARSYFILAGVVIHVKDYCLNTDHHWTACGIIHALIDHHGMLLSHDLVPLTETLLCSAQIVLRAIDTLVRKQSDNVLKNGFQQVKGMCVHQILQLSVTHYLIRMSFRLLLLSG